MPRGYLPLKDTAGSQGLNVNVSDLMKTPQYYLLLSTAIMLCTGGMGLMSVAKPMIGDVFTTSMPGLVSAAFASSYLLVRS
jgi:hypothetical protein